MSNLIFVYGSLKRGYRNWKHILKDRALFVGEALSEDANYAMYDAEAFPKVVVDNLDGHGVAGELFQVDDEVLARCDRLEGNPVFYRREERRFMILESGEIVTAWIYLCQHRVDPEDRMEPVQGNLQWDKYEAPQDDVMSVNEIVDLLREQASLRDPGNDVAGVLSDAADRIELEVLELEGFTTSE
jgi:gamma-glutamylcyclotransferase (GGCT)/AIG2-like uncharacterized protein YtfP